MSEPHEPRASRSEERILFWKEVVWPTARALEAFFWKLLWFIVFIGVVFSFNPFQ